MPQEKDTKQCPWPEDTSVSYFDVKSESIYSSEMADNNEVWSICNENGIDVEDSKPSLEELQPNIFSEVPQFVVLCNSDTICRLCGTELSEAERTQSCHCVFTDAEKIFECTTLRVVEGDRLPRKMCVECMENLNKSHNFIKTCIETFKFLVHTIFNTRSISNSADGIMCSSQQIYSGPLKTDIESYPPSRTEDVRLLPAEMLKQKQECIREKKEEECLRSKDSFRMDIVENDINSASKIEITLNKSTQAGGTAILCRFCPMIFDVPQSKELKLHLDSHKQTQPTYKCRYQDCNDTFELISSRKAHEGTDHGTQKMSLSMVLCDQCGEMVRPRCFHWHKLRERRRNNIEEKPGSDHHRIGDAINDHDIAKSQSEFIDNENRFSQNYHDETEDELEENRKPIWNLTYESPSRRIISKVTKAVAKYMTEGGTEVLCPFCPAIFDVLLYHHELRLHLDSHLTLTKQNPIKCRYEGCEVSIRSPVERKAHECTDHGTKQMILKLLCDHCAVMMNPSRYRQSNHNRRHKRTNARVYECDMCSYRSKKRDTFISHIKGTHQSKYVRCKVCREKVLHNKLRYHYRQHADKKTCEYCKKEFLSRNMKGHLRTHTGEKPFSCADCGLEFTFRVSLKTHRKKHHGDNMFEC